MKAIILGLAIVALIGQFGVTTFMRFGGSDTFMAIAGGKDVLDGKLGKEDTWAFTTEGKVQVNQNWLSGALFCGLFENFGGSGLIAWKIMLLLLVGSFALLTLREFDSPVALSLSLIAVWLLISRSYIDIRPAQHSVLMTSVFVYVLLLSYRKSRVLWTLPFLTALWAQLHGGFMLGLLMIGARLAVDLLTRSDMKTIRRSLLVLCTSCILCPLTSPFGFKIVTVIFAVAEPEWLAFAEWLPIIWSNQGELTIGGFGDVIPYLIFIGAITILLPLQFIYCRAKPSDENRSKLWLMALLGLGVCALAFKSRRFIPLSTIVFLPLVAYVLSSIGKRLSLRVIRIAGLTGASILCAQSLWSAHADWHTPMSAANPMFPPQPAFERMVGSHRFGVEAAKFLSDSKITGRAFHDYPYEGALHYWAPNIKLFVGSRAQVIYPAHLMNAFHQLERLKPDSRGTAILRGFIGYYGVSIAILSLEHFGNLIELLIQAEAWSPIYFDGVTTVFVCSSREDYESLVRGVQDGQLPYRNRRITDASRALAILASNATLNPSELIATVADAVHHVPNGFLYKRLATRASSSGTELRAATFEFLKSERLRLRNMAIEGANGGEIAAGKSVVCSLISSWGLEYGERDLAAMARREGELLVQEFRELQRRYLR